LDNGNCKNVFSLEYFANAGPSRTADCKVNEVDVPTVIGYTLQAAKERLALQPLRANIVYKPARPGQRLNHVVGQFPRSGHASSFDQITIVLAKPLHGIVPKVVGLTLARARARLHTVGLGLLAPANASDTEVVLSQWPRPGVAAGPRMRVRVTLRRGTPG
jgi:beta-lactam-binding protein with PASTA domain